MPEKTLRVSQKLEQARYLYRNGGLSGLLFALAYKLINRFTRLYILRAVVIGFPEVNTAHLGKLQDYRYGFFTAEQMRPFTRDPVNDLTDEFLDYAAAKGDKCFAIIENGVLVNYCWNSLQPTLIDADLQIEFDPAHYYRYKEYTRPSHRGRRLSSYNSAESLNLLANSPKKGFAGYVEADNYVSSRSLQRKNHRFVGFVVALGRGSDPWIWHSPKARSWGFRVAIAGTQLQESKTIA